ncbi:cation:proton antiporter [Streptococcus sp. DD13]|uniref:cation:proton antiporter n=1 Tax=Streptococcus sp. DD13 TaxID=1777881 RepID=UPI0007961526|nr:sodium:proton antiporter [Streptococcus sp. DD13]KXT78241.1 Na+/H+ antiporter [Streptococcus sp. DD13]
MEHLLLYAIVFIALLSGSNILNRLFPRFPLPLIQVGLGVVLGWILRDQTFRINSDLFLAVVIGPLLFREAAESDVTSVLKQWRMILFLIFPVVFLTTLGLGGLGHALVGTISLAAMCAGGAALGPTDLVAFSSLSGRFSFPKRISDILKGEGLLNDASGLVAFQVAVTALTTGEFSLSEAGTSLLLSVLGGFLVGGFFGLLQGFFIRLLKDFKVLDSISVLLLELGLPLVTFFVAEEIHVSGIIAVVVAGILNAARFKRITLLAAEVDTVTETVWETVTFALNGFVFIILGLELVHIAGPILTESIYNTQSLVLLVIVLTVALFLIRFLSLWLFFALSIKRLRRPLPTYMKEILTLTFSGVKGTVSIATIFLIPSSISVVVYSQLLFLVAGVTLLSFLTGVVVLPHLAKPKLSQENHSMQIAILNEVVSQLKDDLKESELNLSVYSAIDNYQLRIEQLIWQQEDQQIQQDLAALQVMMLSIERDALEQALSEGRIGERGYRLYQAYLGNMEHQINRNFASQVRYSLTLLLRTMRNLLQRMWNLRLLLKSRRRMGVLNEQEKDEIAELYLGTTQIILESLADVKPIYGRELVEFLQDARLREAEIIGTGAFVERIIERVKPTNIDEMLRGYYLERKAIAEYEADERISHRYAKRLRKEVNELESYSLKENLNSLPYELMNLARGGR